MRSPKKYLRAVVRVISTNIRLGAGKLFHVSGLRFNPATCLAFSDDVELSSKAKVDFGKFLRTRGHCSFNVQESGELVLGNGIFLNQGCQFNCHSRIEVGDGCEFGPNVLVYDHDHIFRGGVLADGEFSYGEVHIGSGCWIGAGSIILRGTTIGNGCVIAAGSIVKGDVPDGALFVQKRQSSILDAK